MTYGQIVLEDNLLKAYLDFQEGISVDPKLARNLFSYYKPHLTNKSQYDRIGKQMSSELQAQLQASGIKENLSLTELAKESDYSGVKKPSFRNGGNRQTGTLETALAA